MSGHLETSGEDSEPALLHTQVGSIASLALAVAFCRVGRALSYKIPPPNPKSPRLARLTRGSLVFFQGTDISSRLPSPCNALQTEGRKPQHTQTRPQNTHMVFVSKRTLYLED
jgi:hypothetical protein